MKLKRRKKKAAVKLKRRKKVDKRSDFEIFCDMIMTSTTSWYGMLENRECLKCGAVAKGMVRVGCLSFCIPCFNKEFDGNKVERDTKAYSKWLAYQDKVWEKELS